MIAAALVTALLPAATSAQGANQPPAVSPINTENQPPIAHYDVLATDPDGDPLTYTWELDPAEATCTRFDSSGNAARWHHHESDGCSHVSVEHDGTITVTVTDGHFTCTAVYPNGTRTGVGPSPEPCESDGSVPPEDPPGGETPGGGTPDEQPPPRLTPPPEACPASVSGYFEPVQGVFQDDLSFADGSGRQLLQLTPNSYVAELPLVADRPTALFGIDHTAASRPQDRYNIVLEVTTSYTTPVPVQLELRSESVPSTLGLERVTVQPGTLPLAPPCGPSQTVKVTAAAPNGLPADRYFEFKGTGTYRLIAELIAGAGDETGLKVTVDGQVVETTPPPLDTHSVIFAPRSPARAGDLARLPALAAVLATLLEVNLADYFPIPDRSVTVGRRPLLDLSSFLESEIRSRRAERDAWETKLTSLLQSTFDRPTDEALIQAEIDALEANGITLDLFRKWFGAASALTGGRRAIIVMSDDDYAKIDIPSGSAMLTIAQKVILVRESYALHHPTVGHEIAHSLPFVWLGGDGAACGLEYHNVDQSYAHGFQIHHNGANQRADKTSTRSIMGPAYAPPFLWIDQCTYAHLVDVLQEPPDPPLIVVSGRVATSGSATVGQLLPAYQVDGIGDLAPGAGGDHAIVLRAGDGRELGRFPFVPQFSLATHPHHDVPVTGFVHRVPDLPGTASIELTGPGGVLDRLTYSPNPPTVAITAPTLRTVLGAGQSSVELQWAAADADGDELLSTVLYSPDGTSYTPVAIQSEARSVVVPLQPGVRHHFKVVVTDGTQSADATLVLEQPVDGPCPAGLDRPTFLDVTAGSVHAPSIACLELWRITHGVADGRYLPGRPLTRGELATMVARFLDRLDEPPLPEQVPDAFADDGGSSHRWAIDRLAAAGIVEGRADASFGADLLVTRAQLATVLYRTVAFVLGAPPPPGADLFDDDRGSVHERTINALAAAGVIRGVAPGRFHPAHPATRAQAASLLARLLAHLDVPAP